MHRIICVFLLLGSSGCDYLNESCSNVYALDSTGRYEKYMKVAKTWALCATNSDDREKYRFVWLRSSHNPIVIDLVKEPSRITASAVRLDGTWGSTPGETTETRTTTLSKDEFDRFKNLIQQADFWNLQSLANGGSANAGDDSRWILEGAVKDKALAVDRGSNVDGAFREAALFLLEKSKINPNGDIY